MARDKVPVMDHYTSPPTTLIPFASASDFSYSDARPSNTHLLPELPYSIRDHKKAIAIAWAITYANSSLLPLAVTYGLWFGTSLSKQVIFAIEAGVFGVASLFIFGKRTWLLLRKDGQLRPLGSKRGWLDYFQISYALGILVVTGETVAGTVANPPNVRLLSCPPASLLLLVSSQLLVFIIFSLFGLRTFFRVSSLPRGSPIRPAVYTIVEDVIAVDTGTGRVYREALNRRYEASSHFRRMLWQLNLFWAFGGFACAVIVLGIVLAPPVLDIVAYGIGWAVPFLWAIVWAFITIKWVQIELKKEKEAWGKDRQLA